jgi:predicted lipid-binding transport protein (Tim44 family)
MNENFGYIDIILLAMIAGFIILRLRNILGRRTGHDEPVYSNFENKVQTRKTERPNFFDKDDDKLEGQKLKDFLQGAELAYERIITAFAKGDKKELKFLLKDQVYNDFLNAIDERVKNQTKSDLTFIGVKSSNVEKYEKIKNELYATVKFVSEIISVKRNNKNEVIQGDPDKIKTVTDIWKFSKNAISRNPNWYLAEIAGK